ncbi:unnamed protein product [Rotaria sp. Silwood2]|nr:unnamed protein product [Rotaria sp. Silwood2]
MQLRVAASQFSAITGHSAIAVTQLADALHQLAVTQGAVSEIELDNPRVGDAWLDFVIGYDDAGSAKKVINLLEAFNNVQPLTHIRVIEYTPPPNPQPQLIV